MRRTDVKAYLELVRFYRDESGVATIFACFMICMMVLVGGIGVDLMHAEMERTRLQNTLDRAVLAAADREQPLSPDAVVRDYFDKAGMGDYLSSVNVSEGFNFRTVNAKASVDTTTQFMHLMGVPNLSMPANGTAEERISNVEVSLVLDISGSMRWNSKIDNLRTAANEFAEALITEETRNLISLSVIPYSEHVNAGEEIFDAMPNTNYRHPYSYCVEFPDDNFDEPGLIAGRTYDQMQHFQWYYSSSNAVDNTTCPRRTYEAIQAFSQDLGDLEDQFDSLQPRAQTSIFLGVKWAATLLDPSSRPIVNELISNGTVDAAFSGRPSSYDDEDTLKTIVVMTDGVNTDSHRIADWAYDSASDYSHWRYNNFNYWLNRYVRSSSHWQFSSRKYSGSQGDTYTDQICTAAKQQGIVIWSVGFEVGDHGANVLRDCATSESHFFRVEGVEISEAFKAIANQITQLRLTQ